MPKLQKVKLTMPSGSNFDRSKVYRTTLAPGVITPIYCTRMLPGDKISIKTTSVVKTLALMAPTMGSFILRLDHFYAPDRLYVPELRQNTRNTDFGAVEKPYFKVLLASQDAIDPALYGVGAGSLLNHLYFPVGFRNYALTDKKFDALPLMMYDDIAYNWYASPQHKYIPRVVSSYAANDEEVNLMPFESRTLDNIRQGLDMVANDPTEKEYREYEWDFRAVGSGPLSGLYLSCYQPDLFTTILDKDRAEQIQLQTRIIPGEDGSITVDQLRMMYKDNEVGNRNLVAGDRYTDYIRAQWGVEPADLFSRPEFLGSTTMRLTFDDIVSQSNSVAQGEDASTGLGDLGGICRGLSRSGKFKFFSPEFGYYMIIARILPVPDYFQGVDCQWSKLSYRDEFLPGFDGIGFKDVFASEMYAGISKPDLDSSATGEKQWKYWNDEAIGDYPVTPDPFGLAIGKAPAYIEYMTDYNRITGLFATDELRYWTLAREVGRTNTYVDPGDGVTYTDATTVDYSPYVNPYDYNDIFVDTRTRAMNFMCQFAFDVLHRRPIKKNIMPTWSAF